MGDEVWKVRCVKPYKSANNHLFVGYMLSNTITHVRLKCRTFHFGKLAMGLKDVSCGTFSERIVPWNRIECINVLDPNFDVEKARLTEKDGELEFSDGTYGCTICKKKHGY
jgi:hypothetical protein